MSDSPPVLQVKNLQKVYRTGFWLNQTITSLKDCSLQVFQGETFGLLGPNGAGKTTLLKILLGVVRATAGTGSLLGKPLGDRAIRQRIGYLPENPYFYDYLTAWELLQFTAGLFQIPISLQRQRIPQLIDLVGLSQTTARKKQLRQYSKGMLQRVGLAQALINEPEVVFLDEPMSGLDPLGRYQIREIILSLKAQGKTIFFNSHVLSDVEQICDRIAILAQGSLIYTGQVYDPSRLDSRYHVKIRGGHPDALKPWIPDIVFQDHYWQGHIEQQRYQEFLRALLHDASLADAELVSIVQAHLSLEEFFVQQLKQCGITTSQ
jgi:ABC-2 type transport system ATP-binding protein